MSKSIETTAVAVPDFVTSVDVNAGHNEAAFKEYITAVSTELDRLEGLSNYQKRRNTVLAIAWADVTEDVSRNEVFKYKSVVSHQVFYSKKKNWAHGELFADVLEKVTKLTRMFTETQEARKYQWRRDQWIEREYQTAKAIGEKVDSMLRFPVREITSEDGQTVIKPGKWQFRDAAAMMDMASKLARRALSMDNDLNLPTWLANNGAQSQSDELDEMTVEELEEFVANLEIYMQQFADAPELEAGGDDGA